VLSTFGSKADLQIEVVEFSENHFDELVQMYEGFEPKRAAQGLPPVGRDRIIAWLRHLQKNGHNLLALWNRRVIGHSMLCPVDPQRAEFAIFLHQGFRNQGIGTGLTDVTLKYARHKGFRHVWLSVEVNNRCAIRVYRKKGFRVSALFGPEQEMVLDLEGAKGNEVGAHEPAAWENLATNKFNGASDAPRKCSQTGSLAEVSSDADKERDDEARLDSLSARHVAGAWALVW
jgi:RimJ/RimL family protein N-acetyltransferase